MSTRKLILLTSVLVGAVLLPAHASAEPKALTPPALPGVAPLPGPVAAPSKPAANMGILNAKPDIGVPGTAFDLSGGGLPA